MMSFFPHQFAGRVLDDGHGTIQRFQVEQLIDLHRFPGADMVDDDAVADRVYIHTSTPSSFKISAMRMYLPLSACLK